MFRAVVYFMCLFSALVNIGRALDDSSCRTVAEAYAKRVGPPDNEGLPVSPIPDVFLNECSGTLHHTNGASCCNTNMERQFLVASADYLRQHIELSNTKLKTRITQSLNLHQEHLQLSMLEAQNRTSDTLTDLYKIPKEVHKKVLDPFFYQLNHYLLGSNSLSLTAIIESFFSNLFPGVFNYVLSDPSKPKQEDEVFSQCLTKHYNDIQPFGNAPKHLGTKIKFAFRRARIFTETLQVMINTVDSTDSVVFDKDCRKAVSRLQFCSLCSAEVEAKPCRGLCLNVMRGCLSGISEISSSWDELVVSFENLQLGFVKQNNAQELLAYLDGNVTDALLQAMDDGPRIYSTVMSVCRDSYQPEIEKSLLKKFFTPKGLQPSHPSSRIHSIRKDITSLITQLEDSKGFFQRIADGLCRTPSIYDQEMRSDRCWNGSAVGKYIHAVPEANTIAQAQYNLEVRVTLLPDSKLLHVRDTLTHMRRNLSILINEEIMLNDDSYQTVVGSGGGYSAQDRDVVIDDDEDFAEAASGSGSGDRDVDGSESDGEKSTVTTRPTDDRGKVIVSPGTGVVRPSVPATEKPGTRGGTKGSAGSASKSFSLLLICTVLYRIQASL